MAEEIKLGENYRDELTGFEGRAVSQHKYENGCVRYALERAELDENGKPVEAVFDEQRLESVEGEKPAATATAGGSRSVPTRPAVPPRR